MRLPFAWIRGGRESALQGSRPIRRRRTPTAGDSSSGWRWRRRMKNPTTLVCAALLASLSAACSSNLIDKQEASDLAWSFCDRMISGDVEGAEAMLSSTFIFVHNDQRQPPRSFDRDEFLSGPHPTASTLTRRDIELDLVFRASSDGGVLMMFREVPDGVDIVEDRYHVMAFVMKGRRIHRLAEWESESFEGPLSLRRVVVESN